MYAAAQRVVGWTVTVTAGDASVFAGTPNGSHGPLASLSAGQSFTVPTLSAGVVVSLQSSGGFGYTLTPGTPPTEEPTEGPTESLVTVTSVLATWNCTGEPCPWGDQTTSHAAVWPAAAEPSRARHGYTVSHDVYAAAQRVVGWTVTVTAGDASVFAGTPNGSHGPLASLSAGQSFTVPTLSAGVVVSLQGSGGFGYTLTPGTGPVSPPPTPACTDPTTCDPVSWVSSVWRYNGPGSNHPDDWFGGVIAWPSWSAYSSNNRDDLNSRTVYSESGEKLYPYMGAWADGCEIEVVTGGVLVIEWERGLDEWRETYLSAGDTYTINLTDTEDGALIETPNNTEPFEVSLSNCTPQQIDKGGESD